jgi:DNA-binding transcriptional regulator YiaG
VVCGETDEEFIDIKEKDILEFIQEIEEKYNKKAKDMREEKEILKYVIKEARSQTDVKIEELASLLDISKSTVWNYSKAK